MTSPRILDVTQGMIYEIAVLVSPGVIYKTIERLKSEGINLEVVGRTSSSPIARNGWKNAVRKLSSSSKRSFGWIEPRRTELAELRRGTGSGEK